MDEMPLVAVDECFSENIPEIFSVAETSQSVVCFHPEMLLFSKLSLKIVEMVSFPMRFSIFAEELGSDLDVPKVS